MLSDDQWNKLSEELLNASTTRGWRALGQQLMKSTTKKLDHIEKTSNNPVQTMLNDWQDSRSAYLDDLLDALKAIDNYTVVRLINSWVEEYRQNPTNQIKKTTSTQPTLLREVPKLGQLVNELCSCLDKKTYDLSWRQLADELGYDNAAIDRFKFNRSPTEALFEDWQERDSTVERLLEALTHMQHNTACTAIQKHCGNIIVPDTAPLSNLSANLNSQSRNKQAVDRPTQSPWSFWILVACAVAVTIGLAVKMPSTGASQNSYRTRDTSQNTYVSIPSKVADSDMWIRGLSSHHKYELANLLDPELDGIRPAVELAKRIFDQKAVLAIAGERSPTESLLRRLSLYGDPEQQKVRYLYKKLMEDPPMKAAAEIVEKAIL